MQLDLLQWALLASSDAKHYYVLEGSDQRYVLNPTAPEPLRDWVARYCVSGVSSNTIGYLYKDDWHLLQDTEVNIHPVGDMPNLSKKRLVDMKTGNTASYREVLDRAIKCALNKVPLRACYTLYAHRDKYLYVEVNPYSIDFYFNGEALTKFERMI